MSQRARHFMERLNHCFNDMDAPATSRERAQILCKMLDIPRHQAFSILEGHQLPDQELLNQIATEFEVDPKWLIGEI